jgi:hypothetical protein
MDVFVESRYSHGEYATNYEITICIDCYHTFSPQYFNFLFKIRFESLLLAELLFLHMSLFDLFICLDFLLSLSVF